MKRVFPVISLCIVLAAVAAAQTPAPPPIYGVGWQSFSSGLENLEIGLNGRTLDIRFRAEQNDQLQSVVVYMKTGSGYSSGSGGTIRISLQADDGTANHFPKSGELDFAQASPGNPASPTFREFVFNNHTSLSAGTLYHLVFSNTDPNPSSNYVSLNNISNDDNTDYPYYSFTDWQMVWKDSGSSSWADKPGTCPIAAIKYVGGASQGQGYVDPLSGSGLFTVQGSSQVREIFTVSGGNKTVTNFKVHVKKTGSPGDLTVTLATSSGTQIEQGTISASSIGSNYGWATLPFSSSHVLANGTTYYVALSSTSGSGGYQVFPLTKGTPKGLDVPSEFHDGYYQNTSGSSWADASGRTDYDLQLYFGTTGSGTTNSAVPNAPANLTAIVQ